MTSSTPGDERRASSSFLESLANFLRMIAGNVNMFMSSARWAKIGGVSLVFAGLVGMVLTTLSLALTFRAGNTVETGSLEETLLNASFALYPVDDLFLLVGLIGVYPLISGAGFRVRVIVVVGLALLLLRVGLWSSYLFREWLFGPPDPFYSPSAFFYSEIFFFLTNWSVPVGILLISIAALRGRGLGGMRFVPLAACILNVPFLSFAIFWIYYDGVTENINPTFWLNILSSLPYLLANLGWIAFGVVMFGAKERADRISARERRATEKLNISLASRLYGEAFGDGKLAVVDEIVSSDFFDRRKNQRGASGMKQAISDLRHAFPDLKVEIESQTAENDNVTTRVRFSGTDTGGVLYFPPTGRTATFGGNFTDRYRDGKLVEHDGEMDETSLMDQLGHPSGRDVN